MPPSLRIDPTGGPLGAFISGINLMDAQSGEVVYELIQAFHKYQVLIFPKQELTSERQLEVSEWFGPRFMPPKDLPVLGDDTQPEVVAVSNFAPDGVLGDGFLPPHSDLQYMPVPLLGAMLFAIEIPGEGGDTSWSNLHLAYDELDEAMKRKLEGLRSWSANPYAGQFQLKELHGPNQKYMENDLPQFHHPIVRTHPATGRKSLYWSFMNVGISGLDDPAEANELAMKLINIIHEPHLYYTHKWTPGDVVLWDNRNTNHTRSAFDASQRRLLHRVQIAGTRPF